MNLHHELITPNLRTTSRVVAEKFGKLHKNVLRDVEKIRAEAPTEFSRLNFEPVKYLDAKGETRPMVEMTRDGFVLLAMGFTGAAAMEWKVRFIEAFNMMAAELTAKSRPVAGDGEPAAIPADIAALSIMEKASLCREIRLMAGAAPALEKWNWMMPARLRVDPRDPAMPAFTVQDGRACLRHILGFETGYGSVAEVFAGGNGPAGDAVRLMGLGLRWDSHLFVAATAPPSCFRTPRGPAAGTAMRC